ncbi:MAG: acetylxylan esterase [Fusobacteria bacterium]|nr:acetylxylan esterase [Fusobacteriota bacterium]
MTLWILNTDNYKDSNACVGCYRAVEALKSNFMGSWIYVMDKSQGGALTIAVGTLYKEVTKVISEITFLSHY